MVQIQYLYFVVDVDIKGFFDNVNHTKLMRQMWTLGIQDKKPLCIIREMLKAPVILPNGDKIYPDKGTPQGGILSPLLSNIVLNGLDWWGSSQWENIPTHTVIKDGTAKNGTPNRSNKCRTLRQSNLKEMYIVRYADDFRSFCRKRGDAVKTYHAVKQWLEERQKLQISEEKSKVVNLKKNHSEFLGFKLKAVPRSGKYIVRSHMCNKAIQNTTRKLKAQIDYIQHPANRKEEYKAILLYNSMVIGIHQYFAIATLISDGCYQVGRSIRFILIFPIILIWNRVRTTYTADVVSQRQAHFLLTLNIFRRLLGLRSLRRRYLYPMLQRCRRWKILLNPCRTGRTIRCAAGAIDHRAGHRECLTVFQRNAASQEVKPFKHGNHLVSIYKSKQHQRHTPGKQRNQEYRQPNQVKDQAHKQARQKYGNRKQHPWQKAQAKCQELAVSSAKQLCRSGYRAPSSHGLIILKQYIAADVGRDLGHNQHHQYKL